MKKKNKIRICYFGTYSRGEEYARNNAIISGLLANDMEVLPCQVDVWPTHEEKMVGLQLGVFSQAWAFLRAYLKLIWKYLKQPDHDFIFVGYIGHLDMFPARLLAWLKRKPVIFDAFYSLYDTVILDRGLYPQASWRAKALHRVDQWSCQLADLVLLDTWAHVDYFCKEFGLNRDRFLAIPLGTDEKNFFPRPWPPEDQVFHVISYSSYIPLHGIDIQLEAAGLLKNENNIKFTFVGKGQLYPEMRRKAQDLKLENVRFIEWLSHSELVELIARSDLCLGIFGTTEKAARVIPYKVYEALAMRKPVITGDSPAARELLQNEIHVLLSPLGDPQTLAKNIIRLRDNPDFRQQLAERGHRLFMDKCTSLKIAEQIVQDLQRRWPTLFTLKTAEEKG